MMKENWIDDMKRKLEGHKMAPPPGLWEDISRQMDKHFKPLSSKTGNAKRYWAAAAAILALVGFFVFQNGNDSEQPQQANTVSRQPASQQLPSQQPASQQLTETIPVEQEPQTNAPLLALARHQVLVAENEIETKEEVLPESDSPAEVQQKTDEPKQISDDSKLPSDKSQQLFVESQQMPIEPQRTNDVQAQNRWSLGLNASGGLLAANTSQRTDRLYRFYNSNYQNYDSNINQIQSDEIGNKTYAYTLTEYISEHHLPIRFGVSVNYQLTTRIALHSGISYTRLHSEFSIPLYQNISYNQKLHYLGIPFGVTWQLWTSHRFHFYLSGGMMLEKCVSADLEGGGKVSKKPWQWSVDAAAGAEYALTRQLGFYLEPSLGYYFDDGTSLEHYYKEHPLAPSIEFGLRLHLNE